MLTTRELGQLGEELAASFLINKGWSILDRNWRSRLGELDLIALDGVNLVVIEVKTRRSTRYGIPIEAITDTKARRLRLLAGLWLQQHHRDSTSRLHIERVRIDAIGVIVDGDGLCSIDHRMGIS
jgi:putative endonuclease